MRITASTTIYEPEQWGPGPVDISFSQDGALVAVKTAFDANKNRPNVFLYDNQGTLKWSFRSRDGGERGVAFWQGLEQIMIPGCDDGSTRKQRDGLKVFAVGAPERFPDYTLYAPDENLTGVNIQLQSTSDDSRAIVTNRGVYIDGIQALNLRRSASEFYFSPDLRYLAGHSLVAYPWVMDIQTQADVIDPREFFVAFLPGDRALMVKEGSFAIWDLKTSAKLGCVCLEDDRRYYRIIAACASRDGKFVAYYDDHGYSLNILDVEKMEILATLPIAESKKIRRLKFTADGSKLLGVITNAIFEPVKAASWDIKR